MKILKFSASWCAPCKSLSMTLSNMDNLPAYQEIDIDEDNGLVAQYAIRSVPTLVKVDDTGKEIDRYNGDPRDKEALANFFNA